MNQRPELCASPRSLAARDAVIDGAHRDATKQLNALDDGTSTTTTTIITSGKKRR
ncbi:hypothetical protein [Rhodopseudomonas sp. AAP120]|uniref:hypothetical protein n=1 Tax=Rhodopseudomonas sp. AAP120 TaxID=1523430 RepID=UPI000A58F59A|nr:hypothetical protein [Rhodopseudomonas sp. AAP120]